MVDITSEMNVYRECARNLWNTYFLPKLGKRVDWDLRDAFEDTSSYLFTALILHMHGCSEKAKALGYERAPNPLAFIKIVVEDGTPELLVNREKTPASGYWDFKYSPDDMVGCELQFIDCFDFNPVGFREFEYYRVRIAGAPSSHELLGRDALVRSPNAKIFLVG